MYGKSGGCTEEVHALIWGNLADGASRGCAGEASRRETGERIGQKSAEAILGVDAVGH